MLASLLLPAAIIILLIMLSAFFSAAETALIAASKARIHHLSLKGNHRAHTVRNLQNNIGHAISTLLLCNTLVNIFVSSLGTAIAMDLVGDSGVAYTTLILGTIIVIYAEVVPKIAAVNNAEQLALALAPILKFIVLIFTPITRALDYLAKKHLQLFRIKITPRNSSLSAAEELRGAIDLHGDHGEETKSARVMLRNILDLADVEVSQVMRHRKYVTMIDIADRPGQILDQVLASPYTRLPVWQDGPDNIIGVIHAKDLLRAVRSHEESIDLLDIKAIASKPWFIPESTTLFNQLQAFRERREHFALVVDEYGTLMGIVTLEDILEEIVGEITDEHDIASGGIRPQPDGSYLMDGAVPIRDINRQLDWSLPDDTATTIAGLILHESRQIPEVGQHYILFNFRFDVLRRHRNQVTLVKVTPLKNNGQNPGSGR